MVHIMDWSALKFMPTIVPFYEVAVNAPPEIERFTWSGRMSQTGRTASDSLLSRSTECDSEASRRIRRLPAF